MCLSMILPFVGALDLWSMEAAGVRRFRRSGDNPIPPVPHPLSGESGLSRPRGDVRHGAKEHGSVARPRGLI